MQWYVVKKTSATTLKVMMNVHNVREVTMKVKSGYVALYVINGTMQNVFISNLSHPIILLDDMNRLIDYITYY